MADISIPEGDNPVRYQASLGGNQKYRNMGNVSGQAYLVRGQVTNVYYQKGTLDFNTYGSSSTSGVTDGSGSAPIPVDFWGKNTDGKVFGCYRPVQKGSQILVAYIGGDTSRPIVIGVYPDNEASYELISPVHYNTGDDSTDDVQNDALGERKIYPNQQMMYESGKGDILRSMGGKSFLYISENGSGYLDDINYAYDEISDFYDADANEIEPTMTKAQSWLLVHEDNDSDEESDGHRTRFYVNRSGELMVTFANKDDPNNIVVLEASKDSGFKLTKRFDNSNIKEDSESYVQLGIGNGNNVSIKSVDSDDATSFYLDNGNIELSTPKEGSITFDGTSVNDLLGKVSDAENAANDASDKADSAASAGAIAQSAASDAASQALAASYAGEDAKSAAVNAQAAGEDAKSQAKDTRDRIIYYASISNEKDVAVPGKYIIVNTDTYIANGTIKTAHIGDAAITNAKIANLAVGTAQIANGAITNAQIGNLAVGNAQIEDAAITDAKVGNLSASKLTAGTIDFSVINGTHINASEIDVGKIVADQIYVNGLGDISKNLGTVTSGKITGTNVNDDINTVQSGVNDLNNPNLMSVIEKQTAAKQFAGLTSQYNVILARAKDDNISTTDLTTAYTNLDTFITPLLKDTTKASNIDRYTYNSLTDAYNMALSTVQNELSDSFNADIDNMQSSVSVASQAASSATIVASQAAITGDNANQVASRAIVAANDAQSAGNNATSVANNASQAASGAVIAGSTASVNADKAVKVASQAQIAGDNATSVANNASQAASGAVIAGSTATVIANKASTVANEAKSAGNDAIVAANNASQAASGALLAGSTATVSANKASADYQTLSAGVKDGSVVHITTETVIDKGVIGTAEIADAAITNAQIGKEAVGTAQIADLAVGTAQIGDGAITNAKIGKLAVGTAQIANGAITNAQIGSLAVDTANIKDAAISSAKIADLAVGTAQIGNGAITNAKIGKLAVGTAQIANAAITEAKIGSEAVGTAQIKDAAINSAKIAKLAVGTAQIGDGAITNAKIGKLAVGTAQIANGVITNAKIDNVSANKLTAGTIDFNTITGKNINASNITTGKLNTDRLNVNKLSAVSANLGDVTTGSLKGVDIVANTFSTPNGSFTTDANGAITANNMTLIGGTLTSPTINTSTINGSTINGTTINTPTLNLGNGGQLIGSYSVNDSTKYFQPINGTGSLHIDHGYIQSTANILYYNKILNGIGGNKWGHWASSTQFVPAPDQAHPDTGNVAESTLTPAFLKLDIFNADKSSVNSRAYIDGTGLYINSGGTESVISMLSDYELLSNGMAYLNSGIQMNKRASFTFGNLVLNGYHTIAMLDGKAINFTSATSHGRPIEVKAKTFTKLSQLSIKHDITPLSTAESSRLLNAIDVEKFRYTHDGATFKYQYGGVIDDVNSLGSKKYSMPPELLNEDGTGINLDSLTGILIKRVQDQDKMIGELSMRLTRLEMKK